MHLWNNQMNLQTFNQVPVLSLEELRMARIDGLQCDMPCNMYARDHLNPPDTYSDYDIKQDLPVMTNWAKTYPDRAQTRPELNFYPDAGSGSWVKSWQFLSG
jgi:hypothetical protein